MRTFIMSSAFALLLGMPGASASAMELPSYRSNDTTRETTESRLGSARISTEIRLGHTSILELDRSERRNAQLERRATLHSYYERTITPSSAPEEDADTEKDTEEQTDTDDNTDTDIEEENTEEQSDTNDTDTNEEGSEEGSQETDEETNGNDTTTEKDDEPAPTASFAEQVESAVHDLINQERVENGLKTVSPDSALVAIARAHSADMAEHDYFAHEDQNGCNAVCRLNDAAYEFTAMGENIYMMQGYDLSVEATAAMMVDGWMNSPGHRANILSDSFTHGGVGIATLGDSTYATSLFSMPR